MLPRESLVTNRQSRSFLWTGRRLRSALPPKNVCAVHLPQPGLQLGTRLFLLIHMGNLGLHRSGLANRSWIKRYVTGLPKMPRLTRSSLH